MVVHIYITCLHFHGQFECCTFLESYLYNGILTWIWFLAQLEMLQHISICFMRHGVIKTASVKVGKSRVMCKQWELRLLWLRFKKVLVLAFGIICTSEIFTALFVYDSFIYSFIHTLLYRFFGLCLVLSFLSAKLYVRYENKTTSS